MPTLVRPELGQAFREHHRFLWDIGYRMTGSADDADDIVQDTFTRAALHPSSRTDAPLRPWLARIALNLARDALRARRRRGYVGAWLPAPIEDEDYGNVAPFDPAFGAESRYNLRETASFAFLLALEALGAQQRAVLLLRDVFDYSVAEAAKALRMTAANVKTTHHRARRKMSLYDASRRPPSDPLRADAKRALERFLTAILSDDAAAAEACLAEDVWAMSDGGGQYLAALQPILGQDRIVRFLLGIRKKNPTTARYAIRTINGLPALVVEFDSPMPRTAPRMVLQCDFNPDGRIRGVCLVLAAAKLGHIRPIPD